MPWFPLSGSSSDETFYNEENESIVLSRVEWTTSDLQEETAIKVGSRIDEVFVLS